MLVVAGKDLDADSLDPERCDGRARGCFWRIKEDDEAGKNQISFIDRRRRCAVWLHLAPGDAECAEAVRAQPIEEFRRSDPRRVVERQELGLTGLFITGGAPNYILWRALGYQEAVALTLDQHRNAAPLKIEWRFVDFAPARTARWAGFEDRGIKRVPQPGLEMTIEPCEVEHAFGAGA